MKVCFETFGCRLNKAEALQMEAEYLAKGWELTDEHSEADLFVVRGCSVTARAQYDCEKLIYHLRRHYPNTPLHICGCLNKGEAESFPLQNQKEECRSISKSGQESASPLPLRTARAYLKVQDGCSGKCTFCIVPKFRGPSRSIPYTEILDKAKRFIDAGYHEIVITGCNLSLYASEGKRLPDLLATLAELAPSITPLCRFRIGSLEPGACALETVHVMAEHANICRFLHIPVQSGSNRILSAMKRPYLLRDVEALVNAAIRQLPGLGLGCDLMTGFPGETDLDFENTRQMLLYLPFNNAHIFPYSERPGTPAERLGNAIPREIRSYRASVLTDIVRMARSNFARQFKNQIVEVVTEYTDAISGWTSEYLKCRAIGSAPRKSLVRIHVTNIRNDELFGQVL